MADEKEGASIFEATGPEGSPYTAAQDALTGLRSAFGWLADELHSVEARLQEATACAVLTQEIGRAAGDARKMLTDAVLRWFAENSGDIKSLEAGPELKFWPDRSLGAPRVKDHSVLGVRLWDKVHSERVMIIVHGDIEAAAQVRELFRDLVESVMSKTGWKPGRAKEILGEEDFWTHYDRPSVDKLKDGPKVKLGVGNQRFMTKHRKGAQSASYP